MESIEQPQSQQSQQIITIPVQRPIAQPVSPQYSEALKPKKFATNYLLLGIVLLVVGVSFFYFVKYLNGSIKVTDPRFEFKFSNTKGWEKILSKEGSYLSLATIGENNNIISYADVRPLAAEKFVPKIKEEVDKLCRESTSGTNPQNLSTEEVTINNISGFKCEYMVFDPNINEALIISQYILYNPPGKKYGYIITTSFPEKSVEEAKKATRLIQSFSDL